MAPFYGTLAGALAYHADRGNTAWADSDDTERTIALVRATAYIDAAYASQFVGLKVGGREQALQWPRTGATDASGYAIAVDETPVEVEYATYEGALRELVTPGSLNPDIEAGAAQVKREKVGPLETEYALNGSTTAVFQRVDDLLAPLIGRTSPYFGTLVRA